MTVHSRNIDPASRRAADYSYSGTTLILERNLILGNSSDKAYSDI